MDDWLEYVVEGLRDTPATEVPEDVAEFEDAAIEQRPTIDEPPEFSVSEERETEAPDWPRVEVPAAEVPEDVGAFEESVQGQRPNVGGDVVSSTPQELNVNVTVSFADDIAEQIARQLVPQVESLQREIVGLVDDEIGESYTRLDRGAGL